MTLPTENKFQMIHLSEVFFIKATRKKIVPGKLKKVVHTVFHVTNWYTFSSPPQWYYIHSTGFLLSRSWEFPRVYSLLCAVTVITHPLGADVAWPTTVAWIVNAKKLIETYFFRRDSLLSPFCPLGMDPWCARHTSYDFAHADLPFSRTTAAYIAVVKFYTYDLVYVYVYIRTCVM